MTDDAYAARAHRIAAGAPRRRYDDVVAELQAEKATRATPDPPEPPRPPVAPRGRLRPTPPPPGDDLELEPYVVNERGQIGRPIRPGELPWAR